MILGFNLHQTGSCLFGGAVTVVTRLATPLGSSSLTRFRGEGLRVLRQKVKEKSKIREL